MATFNLMDYREAINNYANENRIPLKEATDRFVQNLIVMRDHFEGFDPNINFRILGQQWNRLSSAIRLEQKNSIINGETRRRSRSME